jgi:hypothetical protein
VPIITNDHLRAALGDKFIEGAEYKLKETHASGRSSLSLVGYRSLGEISIPNIDSSRRLVVYTNAPPPVTTTKPTTKLGQPKTTPPTPPTPLKAKAAPTVKTSATTTTPPSETNDDSTAHSPDPSA